METTNTIKGIEVIAYKGMKSDMTCRDFQYEIGQTYKTDKVKINECGFHACLNPTDVLYYYYQEESSRYFKVKLFGEITKCDKSNTKVAATEITILEEITDNFNEVIETTEWWKNDSVLDLLYWSDGFALVRLKDKYNLIDIQGKMLSEQWFNWVGTFNDGFARVQRKEDKQYNFIDKQGKILSDEWFMYVFDFNDGFARVQRKEDKQYNFIDKQGKFLFDKWFDRLGSFHDGFARVERRRDGLRNYIDKNGKYLSDEWFNDAHSFKDRLAKVKKTNGEWAKIDKNGKIVSK